MTINIGLTEPVPVSRDTRQQPREAKRRKHVVTLVMLTAAARTAVDKRTLAAVVVLAIGLAAAKGMASERGMPGWEWYRAQGQKNKSRKPA
jgi:hypothetical protein